jgi:hypothetical protein
MSKRIERRINFYQIKWIKRDKSGVTKDINYINSILSNCPEMKKGDLFTTILEKHELSNIEETKRNMSFWTISKYKKDDLPLKFNESNKQSVGLDLEENEGLYAPTHFIIFDGKFIGAEYNHDGIRSISSNIGGAINKYIKDESFFDLDHVEIIPILRTDVSELINRLDVISAIEVKVSTDYAKRLMGENEEDENNKSINLSRDLFSSARIAAEGMTIKIIYSVGHLKPKKKSEIRDLLNAIKQILSRSDYKENIDTLKLKGYDYDTDADSAQEVDLLNHLMMEKKGFPALDDKTRAVDKNVMFMEIIKSYNSMKEDLEELSYPVGDDR